MTGLFRLFSGSKKNRIVSHADSLHAAHSVQRLDSRIDTVAEELLI